MRRSFAFLAGVALAWPALHALPAGANEQVTVGSCDATASRLLGIVEDERFEPDGKAALLRPMIEAAAAECQRGDDADAFSRVARIVGEAPTG